MTQRGTSLIEMEVSTMEDEAVRKVKGSTLGPSGNGVSTVGPHTHTFELSLSASEEGGELTGQTDMVDGHSHTISSRSTTDAAPDGHTHLLPEISPSSDMPEGPGMDGVATASGVGESTLSDADRRLMESIDGMFDRATGRNSLAYLRPRK